MNLLAHADPSVLLSNGDPGRPDDPLAGSRWRQFGRGFAAAFAGFGWVARHPDARIPVLVAVAVYVAVWLTALATAAAWDAPFARFAVHDLGHTWWQIALAATLRGLAYVLFWVLALLFALVFALPVCAPAFAWVADRTERRWFGGAPVAGASWRTLAVEMARGLGRALALVTLQLVGAALLWLPGFVLGLALPPLGAAWAIGVGGCWNALFLALALGSFALDNARLPLPEQLALVRRAAPLLAGFGLAAQVLGWVPFTVPFLVAAATLLVCRLHGYGHCRWPTRES
ncbi:MAG: hypothetical protein EXR79_04325 [Myxococcales bacterium]|nr:hypothetical protein [Myxococcales bacterium]